MMNKQTSFTYIPRVLLLISVIYAATQIFSILTREKQRDFAIYYYASQAHQEGVINPYDHNALRTYSGDTGLNPYVYPPYILKLFSPLSSLEYKTAYYLYFLLKLGALAGLIFIWLKIVPIKKSDIWALVVTVCLGYRYTVLRELRSGNVSLFEQLLIWNGILLLLRDRSVIGGISIAISSIFKLITMALLPITVIIQRTWRSVWTVGLIMAGTLTTYALLYFIQKPEWIDFFSRAGGLDERGNRNPSSLAFLRDIADLFGAGETPAFTVYIILCAVVFIMLAWAFYTTRKSTDPYPMLYLTLLGYVLLAPRMKDYSLIIVLIPALHIISSMCRKRWQTILGCVLLWFPLIDYQSLLLSAFAFCLTLSWIWTHRNKQGENIELTLNPLRVFSMSNAPARL